MSIIVTAVEIRCLGVWVVPLAVCQDTPEVDAPTQALPDPTDPNAQSFISANRMLLKNWAEKFDCFKAMLHTCEARMQMWSSGRGGDSSCCSGGADGVWACSVDSSGIV